MDSFANPRRSGRLARRLALSAGLATIALGAFGSSSAAAATPATQADSFVESIGVNVHLSYTSPSPYANVAKVRSSLKELGVRYIRDGVGLGRPDVYARYRQLAEEGIKLDFVVGDPLQRWGSGSVSQQLDMIAKEFPNAVASLEGANEFDISGDANWIADLRNYQRGIWEGAKARPALASKPILGPSLVRESSRYELGNVTPWTTVGTMHPYPGGEMPDLESHTNSELSLAALNTTSDPVQATETGYTNAVGATTSGHRPTSEKAAGIYTPRLFLDNYRRGIQRSYDYELVDQSNDPSRTDVEANFGLLHNDWTPKPAYTALQRLIKLVEDPGPAFQPGSLSYSVSGAPASMRSVLLQKRDGSFYLAIWNAVSVWNTASLTEVNPASPAVTLNIGQPVEATEVFRPNESGAAVASAAGQRSIPLSLTPGVTVVRIVPASGEGTTPTPEPEPTPEPTPAPEPETKSPSPLPTPTPPVPAPTSNPVTAAAPAAAASTPASAPTIAKAVAKPSRAAILRSVRGGCKHGCPLRGEELGKARALLHSAGDRHPVARLSAVTSGGSSERLVEWLQSRAATLVAEGPLVGERALRYTTIRIVLEVVGAPLIASPAASSVQ